MNKQSLAGLLGGVSQSLPQMAQMMQMRDANRRAEEREKEEKKNRRFQQAVSLISSKSTELQKLGIIQYQKLIDTNPESYGIPLEPQGQEVGFFGKMLGGQPQQAPKPKDGFKVVQTPKGAFQVPDLAASYMKNKDAESQIFDDYIKEIAAIEKSDLPAAAKQKAIQNLTNKLVIQNSETPFESIKNMGVQAAEAQKAEADKQALIEKEKKKREQEINDKVAGLLADGKIVPATPEDIRLGGKNLIFGKYVKAPEEPEDKSIDDKIYEQYGMFVKGTTLYKDTGETVEKVVDNFDTIDKNTDKDGNVTHSYIKDGKVVKTLSLGPKGKPGGTGTTININEKVEQATALDTAKLKGSIKKPEFRKSAMEAASKLNPEWKYLSEQEREIATRKQMEDDIKQVYPKARFDIGKDGTLGWYDGDTLLRSVD